jgi:SCP-2 sterol transfer family
VPRYLSPEWVQAFNAALADLDLREAIAAAGAESLTASGGTFRIAQIVTGSPEGPPAGGTVSPGGTVSTLLTVEGGRIMLETAPAGSPAADVTIVLSYDDAFAIARGALDPADALAAGRVRIRGELAVLVAGQTVLNAAAAALGTALTDLTDVDDPDDLPGDAEGAG